MQPAESTEITTLLAGWRAGDPDAAGRLTEALYRELKRLAAMQFRRESNAMTLQPTALVHELCINLLSGPPISCENRMHFLHLAARQMRRLIIDYVRRRSTQKRGGPVAALPLDEARDHGIVLDDRIVDVNEALERLEVLDSRAASVVEMRFFGGLTEAETAEILGVSVVTVKRDWEFARSWLLAQLQPSE